MWEFIGWVFFVCVAIVMLCIAVAMGMLMLNTARYKIFTSEKEKRLENGHDFP